MSNQPQVQQPALPVQFQIPQGGNILQVAIGAIVTLVTIMGTRLTTGSAVDGVREHAVEIQAEMLRLSQANQTLNQEIKAMSMENKRLNEMALDIGRKAETDRAQILKLLEGLRK